MTGHNQVERMRAILDALTVEWQDRPALLAALASAYPVNRMSARRMFDRDIAALESLGFMVLKLPTRPPHYRLAGWMSATDRTEMAQSRRCFTCGEVKPLPEFYRDRTKRQGRSYICKRCMLAQRRQHSAHDKPEQTERQARAVQLRDVEHKTYKQIGAELGISTQGAQKLYQRAKSKN